jgi:hypothetical protein
MSEPDENSQQAFAFFHNSGEPPSENDRATWQQVRDEAFPIPVVCGDRPPNFSMRLELCDAGCHLRVGLIDSANDEQYVIHNVPIMVAHMSNMIDREGNVNPTMEQAETQRRMAALN